MKILLAVAVALLIAASIFADYKWRQWMAARRLERDSQEHHSRPPDSRY